MFKTNPFFKNPHLQTILGSLKFKPFIKNNISEKTQKMIIDGGNGVRLLGYHDKHPQGSKKGLVALIHGWEGSFKSAYMLKTGNYLFKKGFDVFRLNLRDHGESLHLNQGLFNSTLIDETHQALQNIALLSNNNPFFIIGFSLGGNFSLRVAIKQRFKKIKNLRHIISVNPPLDPKKACIAIDNNLIYRYYFIKKWRRALITKQTLFPDKYNFNIIKKFSTCMEITDYFVPLYTPYKNSEDYFSRYTLRDNIFFNITIPVTIITSKDDPIINVNDFYNLKTNKKMKILIQNNGGHCGFIDSLNPLPYGSWFNKKIIKILEN